MVAALRLLAGLAAVLLPTVARAAPAPHSDVTYLPVVIWHGMGDSFASESMSKVTKVIQDALPGVYVKSIQIGSDDSTDQRAGFLGNVNEQIDTACQSILDDEIIDQADGINLIGFSQGGQFVRALVERCEGMWPYRMITFGAQHTGIADVPNCKNSSGTACELARKLMRWAYLPFVQSNVVQAQYYRDPNDYDTYVQKCAFLPDINNEKTVNPKYKENIEGLDKVVLVKFEDDDMVVPAESSWFGWSNFTTGEPIPLHETELYTEDLLGLKTLDGRGDIKFHISPGKHMQFTEEYLTQLLLEYFSEDAGAEELSSKLQAKRVGVQARGGVEAGAGLAVQM